MLHFDLFGGGPNTFGTGTYLVCECVRLLVDSQQLMYVDDDQVDSNGTSSGGNSQYGSEFNGGHTSFPNVPTSLQSRGSYLVNNSHVETVTIPMSLLHDLRRLASNNTTRIEALTTTVESARNDASTARAEAVSVREELQSVATRVAALEGLLGERSTANGTPSSTKKGAVRRNPSVEVSYRSMMLY